MQYKTICLQMIQDRPEMYDQLLQQADASADAGTLSPGELRTSHQAWKDRLSQARPGSSESQIASEALEMALKELEDFVFRVASAGGRRAALPGREQWRSSAVIRRPRKAVTRPASAVAVRPRSYRDGRRRRQPLRLPIPFSLQPRPGP